MLSFVSNEQTPYPPTTLQSGKTAFYETLEARERSYRQELSEAIRWFRPVDRMMKKRAIAQIDRLLENVGVIIMESRAVDATIAQNEAVLQTATDIVTAAQDRLVPPAERMSPVLDHDATTETTFPIVEHG